MKNIKFYVLSFLSITFVSLYLVGCESDTDDSSQTSAIKVRLVDAPGGSKEVIIDVSDIMVANSAIMDDLGWVSFGNTPSGGKIYNLLDLTGGVSLMLSDTLIPSAYLGQVRLLLGDKNTVMLKDGTIKPLSTPSAQQSGLKLKVNQTLLGGVSYDFLIDFDVDHSVVKAGNSGNYNLHPVMRVTTAATSGVIKGTIANITVAKQVLVSVVVGTETVTTYANAEGVFQLNGVPPGTYIVTLTPDSTSGLVLKTIPDVIVVNGAVKDLGSITL